MRMSSRARKSMLAKVLVAVLALALCTIFAVGGTIAWLTASTSEVKNTFTYGDINIELGETTGTSYKMIPGSTITKDPVVTVKADSEACWLFVKVEKSSNFDTFMTYTMADGWTALANNDGVFYRKVDSLVDAEEDSTFAVIKDNKVTVKDTVTKDLFTATGYTDPTLTFTAYAVQQENITDAATAWAKVSN